MSDIKIQRIKKKGKSEFLSDQLFRLLDEFLGPVFLAFVYYILLWGALILFCSKEMAGILNAILTGRIDWLILCGCSAKILICVIFITFMGRRAIKGRDDGRILFQRIRRVGVAVVEIGTIVGLIYTAFSNDGAGQ